MKISLIAVGEEFYGLINNLLFYWYKEHEYKHTVYVKLYVYNSY